LCLSMFRSAFFARYPAVFFTGAFFFAALPTAFVAALPAFEADALMPIPAGASSGINFAAIGDPSPLQASHPGPAEKAGLFPTVMSLNPEAALAA
jgi:hypothetical protein